MSFYKFFLVLIFSFFSFQCSEGEGLDTREHNGLDTGETEDQETNNDREGSDTDSDPETGSNSDDDDDSDQPANNTTGNEEDKEEIPVQEASARLSNGLAGYWSFDQGIDAMQVADDSGNGISGTIDGNVTASGLGKSGGAMSFTGGHINLGNPAALNFDHNNSSTAYTISAWIKTSAAGSVFAKRGGSIQYQMFVNNLENGTIAAHIGTESNRYSSSLTVRNNIWRHVAMKVYYKGIGDGPYIQFYVDGQPSGSEQMVTGTDTNSDDIWIGKRPGGFTYSGMMDEIAVWNRALADDEIEELYQVVHPKKASE